MIWECPYFRKPPDGYNGLRIPTALPSSGAMLCTSPKTTSAAQCLRPTSWAGPKHFERWQKALPRALYLVAKTSNQTYHHWVHVQTQTLGLYSCEVLKDSRMSQAAWISNQPGAHWGWGLSHFPVASIEISSVQCPNHIMSSLLARCSRLFSTARERSAEAWGPSQDKTLKTLNVFPQKFKEVD